MTPLLSRVSSRAAMEKYSGGVAHYRAAEGKEVLLPYRGPVAGIPWTWERLYDIQDTEDVKEGFRSFVEKRKPKFTGR